MVFFQGGWVHYLIRSSRNPVRQAGQVLFPMKDIQAKECLIAQPKPPSPVHNGARTRPRFITFCSFRGFNRPVLKNGYVFLWSKKQAALAFGGE